MKPYIKGVIVVEGFHDSAHLRKYFDCETIETSGAGIRPDVLERIQAAKSRGDVIILTDPDTPGERIRRIIDQAVPGCMHAYVPKEKARTAHKVGVEHADYHTLCKALEAVMKEQPETEETIRPELMLELGLLGGRNSAEKRRHLASNLHIAFGSASKMRKEMNRFGISEETVRKILNG